MLEKEIEHLVELNNVGLALAQLAEAQFPGLQFVATEQGRFVATPHNYVTFKIHWQRARNITVTLRGNPLEFQHFEELALTQDRPGYSKFRLELPVQLAAAAMHIRRAAELYRAGRSRKAATPSRNALDVSLTGDVRK